MIVPSFGNQNPKSNNEQFGVMKAVTPKSLNAIEARAAKDLTPRSTIRDDVLALVAAYRELEAEVAQLTRDEPLYHHEWEKMLNARAEMAEARAEDSRQRELIANRAMLAAEARVKELEAEVAETVKWRDAFQRDYCAALARVAVLREALAKIETETEYVPGKNHFTQLSRTYGLAAITLKTLDPAATALTERLKAAEAAIEQLIYNNTHLSQGDFNALAAWRNVKGEPLSERQPKTTDRCPDCGAYVGPKGGK